MADEEFDNLVGSDRLSAIASRLKAGGEVSPVSVRMLLAWYGQSRRGFWVVQHIRAELQRAGLRTVPDFEAVYLDGRIAFTLVEAAQLKPAVTEPSVIVSQAEAVSLISTDSTAVVRASDPTIRISRLAAANKSLVFVTPDALLAEAVTQMLHYDYSQLPVMSGERDVKGVISWNSIGARLSTGVQVNYVRDAMDAAVEAPDDVSLFAAIPIIVKHDYLLVRASDKKIAGIITSSDLGLQFQQLAEPFLLLGEIENYIRRVISAAAFTANELATARDPNDSARNVEAVEDMSFGEYIQLLQRQENWNKTGLKLDRKIFCGLLDEVRQIRNDVMHFDPDGVADDDLQKLRRLTGMFQRLGSIDSL